MKKFFKHTFFIGLLLTGSAAMAQITGPTPVAFGSTQTYTYNDGSLVNLPSWDADKGVVVTFSSSGTTYTAQVQWTTAGTGHVYFYENGTQIASKTVTVNNCTISAPTSTSSNDRCGTGTVTLTATAGSGGDNVRWYDASVGGSPLATSTSYTTSSLSSGRDYYMTTLNTSTNCESYPRTRVAVTINAIPSPPSSVNGATRCGPGSVTMTGTVVSPSTEFLVWYSDPTAGSYKQGTYLITNSPYTISNQASSQYFYVASSNAAGCESTLIQPRTQVLVTINPIPTQYTMGGGGSYCSGGGGVSVTLSGSQSGVNYQLQINGSNSGSAVAGTGSALTWSSQTTSGTYTVVATNPTTGCTQSMSGSSAVSINALPTQYNMGGGGAYCSGGSGVNVTLSGSQSGVNYQLQINGSNSGSAVAGTGSALTWSSQTSGGTYTVVATNASTGCIQNMSGSAAVTVNALPTQYSVGGGGSYCSGGSVSVTLSGSQTGVNYQLQINGSNSGSAVAGTGSALTWSGQTTTGTYTIVATNASTGCVQNMSGSATVTGNALPTQYTVGGGGSYCSGGSGVSVTQSGSQSGVNYQLQINGSNSGSVVAGTGSALTWSSQTTAGTYTVVATNASTSCSQNMSGSTAVTVNPTPSATASNQTIYVGSSTNVSITSNVTGTTFSFTTSNNTNVSNAASGSGSTIAQALTVTDVVNPGNITYVITPTAAGCSGSTVNSVVSVYPVPATFVNSVASSPSTTYYNNYGYPITLSTKTFYSSYQWYNNGAAISGATSSTYAPLAQGVYTVQALASGATQPAASPVINVSTPNVNSEVNSVSRTVFYKSGLNGTSSPYTLQPSELSRSITFSDGLGRAVQSIGVGQSPSTADIVFPTVPGKSGLTDSTFLPYATSSVQGYFHKNAVRGTSSVTSYTSSEQYSFYQNTAKVATDANPYARVVMRNTPDARVIEHGAPGAAWQPGTSHTVRNQKALATAATYPVLFWNTNGTTTGYYTDNTVWVTTITDENNHIVNTYTNKLGQTVLKQVQAGASTWLLTYYIYDNYGQLIYQVPPKAMTVLGNGTSLDANSTSVAELIYQYKYDSAGNVIEKKVPGSAKQWMVYDKLGRVVFTQDGNQRTQGVWAFVKYDFKNRPVYTGLYTSSSDRPTLQKVIYNINYSSQPWFETRAVNATYQGYTNTVFPTTNLQLLTASYYDDYDFDSNGTADYTYDNAHLTGMPNASMPNPRGLATGNKRLILGTSNWLATCIFYDKLDRPIQAISNNHVNLGMNDKTSVLYFVNNLSTKPQKIKTTHTAATTINVTQRYTYDNAWRAVGIYQSIDNEPNEQLVALYKYNALGQRVEKNLHLLYDAQDGQTGTLTSDDLVETQYNGENQLIARNSVKLLTGYSVKAGATMWKAALTTVTQAQAETNGRYLQSVDYRYNIRGWLTSINNAQLNNDGAVNDDANDFFGMELFYNNAENSSLNNTAQYNGNISAVKWKNAGVTSGATDQRSYKYAYDYSDKLSSATFQAYPASGGTGWTKEANTLNESMTYDANGNISTLARNQNQRGLSGTTVTSTAQTIDNLTYTYASGNQLSKVDDGATAAGGFTDGANQTSEYAYNTHGSLTADQNKGISNITYNVLGKEQQVTFSNGNTIVYTYDAAGTKLKTVTTVGGTPTTADYVNNFVYNNGVLGFFGSPEGRVVKKGSNYEYQYAIADHQGNTRVVFTSAAPIAQSVSAGFETANQSTEASGFSNYPSGSHINTVAINANSGTNSLYLNGGYSGQVAMPKNYKVFPGDKLQIQAYAKYNSPTGNASNLNGFASALLSAFNLAPPVAGETGTAPSAINTFGGLEAGGWGDGTSDQNDPKVFVNIVLFDQNYKFLDVTFAQLTTSGALMSASYTVKEAGYAYLYVSNEHPTLVDVYFDDVMMSYTPSNVIQSSEYYPFASQTANSWTRDNSSNNFLGNGGTELNTTSSLYDLEFRNYDPILGRLNQVDPLSDQYASITPYNYSFNSPVVFNDINGADPLWGLYTRDEYYHATMGRDQAWAHGGGTPLRYHYYQDSNGNGVQDGGEQMVSYGQVRQQYGSSIATITDPGAIAAVLGYVQALASGTSGFGTILPADGRSLAIHIANGDYAQIDASGNAFVPYTDISYWDYKRDQALGRLLNGVQTALDFVGLVPGIGEVADGLNASIYSARGDYANAALSAVAMIPIAGWAATGAKFGKKAIVIGEGMNRVKDAARSVDAKWYQAWKKNFPKDGRLMSADELNAALKRNERWLNSKINQGYTIFDIGPKGSSISSPFYQLERDMLTKAGYPTSILTGF